MSICKQLRFLPASENTFNAPVKWRRFLKTGRDSEIFDVLYEGSELPPENILIVTSYLGDELPDFFMLYPFPSNKFEVVARLTTGQFFGFSTDPVPLLSLFDEDMKVVRTTNVPFQPGRYRVLWSEINDSNLLVWLDSDRCILWNYTSGSLSDLIIPVTEELGHHVYVFADDSRNWFKTRALHSETYGIAAFDSTTMKFHLLSVFPPYFTVSSLGVSSAWGGYCNRSPF
jgi:hypothetical protein